MLYLITGIALFLIWRSSAGNKPDAYLLFALQVVLNGGWTLWISLIVNFTLIATITLCIIRFRRYSMWASRLFVPYLLWVCFATYLNFGMAILN